MNNTLKDILFLLRFFLFWITMIVIVLLAFIGLMVAVETTKAANTEIRVSCVDYNAEPPNFYISVDTDQDIYLEVDAQEGNVLMLGDWPLSGGSEWAFVAMDADSWIHMNLWAWLSEEESGIVAQLYINGNDHSFPQCGAEGWRPGAPSVPIIDPPSDCFWLFARNEDYDNNPETSSWSIVTDEAHPDGILFHYGDSLIANPVNGQSTDPNDYQAVETACF